MTDTGNDAQSSNGKQCNTGPFQANLKFILRLIPGLLAAALLAWVSVWLSEYTGTALMGFRKSPISAVTMAILLGMLIGNLVSLPAVLKPGLTFAMKKVLRLGIIMLGIRLSVMSVFKLGVLGIPIVLLCIAGALLLTTRLNSWLKLPDRVGTLIAVGTSICGVTAIVAAAPAIDAEDEEVAYAIAVITTFGLVAMLTYPYLAHSIFGGDAVKSGLFMGTSIHETAQVAGAGLVYADIFSQPLALDVATITKLVRNVFMAAVIPVMALHYTRKTAGSEKKDVSFTELFPTFILGFLGFAVIRSIGDAGVDSGGYAFGLWDADTWQSIHSFIKDWAVNFMVIALAGVGLSTNFKILKGLGIKPFVVGLGAALAVGVISLTAIWLLGAFVVV
ncbi:MAG: putative sulfate exporter family transporter [Chloroflexota bacterium]|nr:putative sulfate exporter family transporter [Chloroflexota bacterium]